VGAASRRVDGGWQLGGGIVGCIGPANEYDEQDWQDYSALLSEGLPGDEVKLTTAAHWGCARSASAFEGAEDLKGEGLAAEDTAAEALYEAQLLAAEEQQLVPAAQLERGQQQRLYCSATQQWADPEMGAVEVKDWVTQAGGGLPFAVVMSCGLGGFTEALMGSADVILCADDSEANRALHRSNHPGLPVSSWALQDVRWPVLLRRLGPEVMTYTAPQAGVGSVTSVVAGVNTFLKLACGARVMLAVVELDEGASAVLNKDLITAVAARRGYVVEAVRVTGEQVGMALSTTRTFLLVVPSGGRPQAITAALDALVVGQQGSTVQEVLRAAGCECGEAYFSVGNKGKLAPVCTLQRSTARATCVTSTEASSACSAAET
jgi:hypothetical protein